ncbi:Peptidoglycan/LPS O-acetylase OafA/YrhL, contains acyltransferase and SGNH-hydrolase domains [Ruminococcaceae bacterium YRB3002]|nr:Peptidoglycan/LPS O-acetylase OafA/YrhL, contains acyltransferase and SGNH-hydrolase domains [Ruminococcaceae bacterium YRB3002]
MKGKSRINGEIECLRFLFAVAVLMFHAVKYFRGEPDRLGGMDPYFFIHGAVGVEFFFICSGFFMAASIARKAEAGPSEDTGKETISFMIRKIKGIAPVHILFFVTAFISLVIVRSMGIGDVIKNMIDSVPAFFLIQMAGFKGFSPNHVSWYLSVMLISMMIIYPVARRFYSTFVRVIAPTAALLILGFLFFRYGSLTGVMVRCGIFYKSMLRGFAEILAGMTCYEIAVWFKAKKLSKTGRLLVTLTGIILLAASGVYIMHTLPARYEFFFVPVSALFMIIAYSEQGLLYRLFDNRISVFLGKMTLPMYLAQVTFINLISFYGKDLSFCVRTLILAAGVSVSSVVYVLISDALGKARSNPNVILDK